MKSQGVRGRAIAGDCWDLGALRDGNYGSRFLALSRSVLLACCPLHGFIRPRSKCEGRRASQRKCSVNKDLPHQQSCGKGDACHSPCLITMPFSLKDCLSVQSFRQASEPHAGFLWKSPSSWGDFCNSRAHRRLQSQTSHHRQGLACPMKLK